VEEAMKLRALSILLAVLIIASLPLCVGAQQKPLTKDQVLNLVRNQLGDEAGAKAIEQRGIDFEPAEDFLKALKDAGANDAFIQAVRMGKRTTDEPAKKPLNQVQVLALLAGDVSSRRVAMLVEERGIDFEPTDDYLKTLQAVGAEDVLLQALRKARVVKPQTVDPAAQARQAQVQQHLARGLELARQRQFAQAEQEYRAALELDPGNSDLHSGLAYALAEQNKHDDALLHGREAVRLNPASDRAHKSLGDALSAKGDLDGAIAEYREALRLNPNNHRAHHNLGNALWDKGDLDGAIAEFREGVRLDPNNDLAHNNLGSALLAKGDHDGAIAEFREALRLNPNFDPGHYSLGVLLEGKGDRQAALEEYRAAYALKPDNSDYKNAYERLLRKLKK
jgi:tetratricopeptide (TPR) repeat protein